MIRRLLLTIAATAALAACAGERPVRILNDDGSEVLLSVANGGHRSASRRARAEAAADQAEADETQMAALPPPTVTAEDIARAPDPFALEGQPIAAARAAFGDPSLRRREPPAEIWQYRTGGCVLDLVLYPDGAGGALQVAHVAVRPVDAPAVDGRTCAAHVLAATPGRD